MALRKSSSFIIFIIICHAIEQNILQYLHPAKNGILHKDGTKKPFYADPHCIAQCAFCKVRCHCIFYGPGIRYSGIFCVPCISSGYSDIFWHISVVDTVAYFGGNHGSRVWKSLKLKKVYFPRTRTSWDKYMLNRIVFFQI